MVETTENLQQNQITQRYTAELLREDRIDFLEVKRYSLLQRFQHWGNSLLMYVMFVTGFEIYLGRFPLGGFQFTQTVHVWAGLLLFFLSFFLYTFILIYERRISEVFPSPRDFLDLVLILGCALGIISDDKYPHYDYYNTDKKKHINKYHPTQKFLASLNYIMLFFIAMSGFALYEQIIPGNWPLFASIGTFVMQPVLSLNLSIRFFHFIIYAYFMASTMIHFYFTMLPQNRERLRGMVTGNQRIPKI